MTNEMKLLMRVKKTQIEMIRDRGYTIDADELELLNYRLPDFLDYMKRLEPSTRSSLTRIYMHPNTKTRLLVYYTEPSASKELLKDKVQLFTGRAYKEGVNNAILITSQKIESRTLGDISEFEHDYLIKVQIFLDQELAYNATKHYFVPNHVSLSKKTAVDFLDRNIIKLNQLPIIRTGDPISKYYDYKPGVLIRIHRKNLAYESMVPEYNTYKITAKGEIEEKKR